MSHAHDHPDPTKIHQVLTREEIQRFNTKSDLAGLRTLTVTWAMIAGCFAVVALWPNPLTVLVALVLLGGRQLGLAVVMHDCGHKALFKTPRLNRFVGRWLAGGPIWSDVDSYMSKHRVHHASAGSEDDPDLQNYEPYAVTKASFRRKILRDLTGRTGLRSLRFFFSRGPRVWWRSVVSNALLFALLAALGQPWLYLLWIGAYLTTNMLVSRIRQAAEHAVVPDLHDPDPRLHTRTTLASWWERLTIAPNGVNYHLEHHLMPGVPPHQLPKLHRLLKERGFYENADIAPGYADVVSRLTVKSEVREPSPA